LARRPPERLIELGRVAGSYGVHGWVKVVPYSEALAVQPQWWIGGRDYPVEQAKAHANTLIAKLGGVGSREQALELKGSAVAVTRQALPAPPQGIYYWTDLIGLRVVNRRGETLGSVQGMTWNGAHDVMSVAGGRVRLIPWVGAVVADVDLDARVIRVEWETDW